MSSESQPRIVAINERRGQLREAKSADADKQKRSDKDSYLDLVKRVNAAGDREMQRALLAR